MKYDTMWSVYILYKTLRVQRKSSAVRKPEMVHVAVRIGHVYHFLCIIKLTFSISSLSTINAVGKMRTVKPHLHFDHTAQLYKVK